MTLPLAIPIVILLLTASLAALNYYNLADDRLSTVENLLKANARLKQEASEARREAMACCSAKEDADRDKVKAERLYKETLESLAAAHRGLDVQQAELESLREQSEIWDEMKDQLQDEVERLQGELRKAQGQVADRTRDLNIQTEHALQCQDQLEKEARDTAWLLAQLDNAKEQIAVKDRVIKNSRDAIRRLRSKLSAIHNLASCDVEVQASNKEQPDA